MVKHGDDDRPVRSDAPAAGSTAGHGVTSRVASTHDDTRDGGHRTTETTTVRGAEDRRVLPAKTSAAAAFALVFGLAALFCALTAILSPAAVLFGLIGIILGIAGMKMAKRPGVTGKGVAIGGLVTAVLGLLLGGAVLAGAAVLVNDEQRLDQIQQQVDDLRSNLPSTEDVREELPG